MLFYWGLYQLHLNKCSKGQTGSTYRSQGRSRERFGMVGRLTTCWVGKEDSKGFYSFCRGEQIWILCLQICRN